MHITSPHVGAAVAFVRSFASVLDNELGDEHDSGATYLIVSLRVQVMEGDL